MDVNYQQQALQSASGMDLVLALYDGALRFLYRAIEGVEAGDDLGRRIAVKRVVDILMYLQARLRTDVGGRPALALTDFYTAMFTMTLEASALASKEQFLEVISCIRNVREAWVIVARDPTVQRMLPRELCTRDERAVPGLALRVPSHGSRSTSRWSA